MCSRNHAVLLLLSLLVLDATACSSRRSASRDGRETMESTKPDVTVGDGASESSEAAASQSSDTAVTERDASSDASPLGAQDAGSGVDASARDATNVSTDATARDAGPPPDSVGRGCLPDRVPVDKNGWPGFETKYAYAEPSVHCGDDPCLVYHVDNGTLDPVDLTFICDEANFQVRCTPRYARHNNVYCSCRCDEPSCQCAPNFECKPIAVYGQRGLQPYCVWKGASWIENPDAVEDEVADSGLPPPTALDLLVVIDNSAAMAEEQKKLFEWLDDFVAVLAYGNRNGQPSFSGLAPDFAPMESMHLGVISADLGLNGAPAYDGCGELSFRADERDPSATSQRLHKPLGDDGLMQTSFAVAFSGVYARSPASQQPVEIIPGDPRCAPSERFGMFPSSQRYVRLQRGVDDPVAASLALGCIARLGRNGCDRTQPLEAALKALTPPDSALKFTRGSDGHGTALAATRSSGPNGGFLRDDALLVVLFLSGGDDCSIPDASNGLFDPTSAVAGQRGVRCGLPVNQSLLHDVSRYVEGLRALKSPAYRDRILIGAIAGMPTAPESSNMAVRTGRTAIGALLAEEAMQFRVVQSAQTGMDEPAPACTNIAGHGSAGPSRRLLTLAREFGNNAFVGSVCESGYSDLLHSIVSRIITRWRAR